MSKNASITRTIIFGAAGLLVGAPPVFMLLVPLVEKIQDTLGDLAVAHIRGLARAREENSYREHIEAEDVIKRANLEKVCAEARSMISNAASPPAVDADWAWRFINWAADAMSTDAQIMWARALAGMYNGDGKTSLRTLGIIRNMSGADAKLFRDAVSSHIRMGDVLLTPPPLPGVLTDWGIVRNEALRVEAPNNHGQMVKIPIHGHDIYVLCVDSTVRRHSLHARHLTNEGLELCQISKIDTDIRCVLDEAGRHFNKENGNRLVHADPDSKTATEIGGSTQYDLRKFALHQPNHLITVPDLLSIGGSPYQS